MSNNNIFLFYSNFCQHSKRLINRIKTSNIINNFNIVNIDDNNINLPPFIEVVPTIYLADSKKILINDELFSWIESNISGGSNSPINNEKIKMSEITGSDDILAFQQGEMISGSGCTSYSFIEESDNNLLNHNFSYLDDRDNNKLPSFTKSNKASLTNNNTKESNKSNPVSNAYEKMMADRQKEMQSSLPNMRV